MIRILVWTYKDFSPRVHNHKLSYDANEEKEISICECRRIIVAQ